MILSLKVILRVYCLAFSTKLVKWYSEILVFKKAVSYSDAGDCKSHSYQIVTVVLVEGLPHHMAHKWLLLALLLETRRVSTVSMGKWHQWSIVPPASCCICQDLLPLWSLLCGGVLSVLRHRRQWTAYFVPIKEACFTEDMMQRACKLEISGCLPISIPRSLVLTNTIEYAHCTRECRERLSRRWDRTKHRQPWSSTNI